MGPWYQNNILKKAENKFIYQGDNIKQTTQKYKKNRDDTCEQSRVMKINTW